MKILMMVPLWKRPDIVRLFIEHMLKPKYANLVPLFILSNEDPTLHELVRMTEGFKRFFYKNEPLGEKKNAGMLHALTMQWDYYMDMGSDNIWTENLWDLYKPYFDKRAEYFGVKNHHVLNYYEDIAYFLPDYHIDAWDKVTALGVGRCIRRDVVEKNIPLWRDAWHHGMDGCSHFKLTKAGVVCDVIDNGTVPTVIDIKTNTNLTAAFEIDMVNDRIDAKQIKEQFGIVYTSHCTAYKNFEDFHNAVLKASNMTATKEDAFNSINIQYQKSTGEKRYSSYNSYKVTVTKKHRK